MCGRKTVTVLLITLQWTLRNGRRHEKNRKTALRRQVDVGGTPKSSSNYPVWDNLYFYQNILFPIFGKRKSSQLGWYPKYRGLNIESWLLTIPAALLTTLKWSILSSPLSTPLPSLVGIPRNTPESTVHPLPDIARYLILPYQCKDCVTWRDCCVFQTGDEIRACSDFTQTEFGLFILLINRSVAQQSIL